MISPNRFTKDELLGGLEIAFNPLENEGIKEDRLIYDHHYVKDVSHAASADTALKLKFKIVSQEEEVE